jgi:hypothetical protein
MINFGASTLYLLSYLYQHRVFERNNFNFMNNFNTEVCSFFIKSIMYWNDYRY